MESNSKLHSQIAQQAGVSDDIAQTVAYLVDLSRNGRTLDQAAALLRKGRSDVRDMARDWGLSFCDYTPANPVVLTWTKPERGQWVLTHGGATVARVSSDPIGGCRNYTGRWERADASIRKQGSSAEVAARRLSIEIDRRSIGLFGVDDIEIIFPLPGDARVRLAPKIADNAPNLRAALEFAA